MKNPAHKVAVQSGSVDDQRIPQEFFETLHETFRRAEEAVGGSIDRFYEIGGLIVRLRFAGDALVPYISHAFDHLAVEPTSAPSLTICLWDSISTETAMPPPPWSADDYLPRGEIRGYSSTHIHTAFHPGVGTLSMFDSKSNTGLFWIHGPEDIPAYVTGSPLHAILSWWAHGHGLQLIHAAAVGTVGGGVLVVGKGGSGKSTTALSCLQAGLLYVGDDYVLVDERPYVYSLYNSAKLNSDQARSFPTLFSDTSSFGQSNYEKTLTFLYKTHPDQLAASLPIKAILLPKITDVPNSRLERASAGEILAGLAPSTLFQLPGADRSAFHGLARLVTQVPNYVLHLGSDLETIPDVILGAITRSRPDVVA